MRFTAILAAVAAIQLEKLAYSDCEKVWPMIGGKDNWVTTSELKSFMAKQNSPLSNSQA